MCRELSLNEQRRKKCQEDYAHPLGRRRTVWTIEVSLKKLVKAKLGCTIQGGPHSAAEDAMATTIQVSSS